MRTIRKAVISAAGRGTRQYPATNSIQKELIPIVDVDGFTKPALQIIVEEALASGIEEICIVANPGNIAAIKSHFKGLSPDQRVRYADKPRTLHLSDQLSEIESRLTYVVQETQEGYGHAVYQAKEFVGDGSFLMLLGDHIYVSPGVRCAKQVADQYAVLEAPIASVTLAPETHIGRYGIVLGTPIEGNPAASKIIKMVEKPSVDFARAELRSPLAPEGMYFAFFGIHALPNAIFDCLKYLIDNNVRYKNEIQFTTAQELLLKESPLYVALTVEGKRYDIGVPDGLIETQVALALYSPYAEDVYETIRDVERQKAAAAGLSS